MRSLLQIPMLILTMLLVGAIGIFALTDQPFVTCLFQAFVLLTTVGSEEPQPMTDPLRWFIILYLSCGLGIFTYSVFQFGQMLVNADLRAMLERRKMQKKIADLKDHFIICGYGRMGAELCSFLARRGQPFVIIDENAELLTDELRQSDWLFLVGDASSDDILREAGIHSAQALTTVLATDADNLYVVLSARMLSRDLKIIARATDERAARKMTHAGATRVINPLSTGAQRMARFMLSPGIENFIEVTETGGVDWEIAEVTLNVGSGLSGVRLNNSPLRAAGIMLLGVSRENGRKYFPPPGDLELQAGDNLFAFGSADAMTQLSELVDAHQDAPPGPQNMPS